MQDEGSQQTCLTSNVDNYFDSDWYFCHNIFAETERIPRIAFHIESFGRTRTWILWFARGLAGLVVLDTWVAANGAVWGEDFVLADVPLIQRVAGRELKITRELRTGRQDFEEKKLRTNHTERNKTEFNFMRA